MTANTVTELIVPASSTGVVVQTIGRAAIKTAGQAFFSVFTPLATASLTGVVTTIQAGDTAVIDLNVFTSAALAGGAAAGAALISFVGNFFGAKTLPAGETVKAQVKP